jgi:hypothetical protein
LQKAQDLTSRRAVTEIKISKPVIPPIGVIGFSTYSNLDASDVIAACDLDDGTVVLLRSAGYVKVLQPHEVKVPTDWGHTKAWTALPSVPANSEIKAMASAGQNIRIVAVKTADPPYYVYLLESSTGGDSWGSWTQIEQSTFLIADSTDVAMTYYSIFLLEYDYAGAGIEAFWEYTSGTWRRTHRTMLAVPVADLDSQVKITAARKGEIDYVLFSAMPTWARVGGNEKISQLYYVTFHEGFLSTEMPIAGYEQTLGSRPILKPGLLATDGYFIFTGQISRPNRKVKDDFEGYINSNLEDVWVSSPANNFILSGISQVYAKSDPSVSEGTYSLFCSGNMTDLEHTALWTENILNQDFEIVAKAISTEASGGVFGVVVRCTDETSGTEDGYVALIDSAISGAKIYRYNAGVATELATENFACVPQVWYSIGVRVLANNIQLFASAKRSTLFDAAVLDYSDTDVQNRFTNGRIGFMAIGSKAGFDDLVTNAYDVASADNAIGVGSDPLNAARTATYSLDSVGNITVESAGYLYSFDRNGTSVTKAVSPFASDLVKKQENLLLDVTVDALSWTTQSLGGESPGQLTLNLWSVPD